MVTSLCSSKVLEVVMHLNKKNHFYSHFINIFFLSNYFQLENNLEIKIARESAFSSNVLEVPNSKKKTYGKFKLDVLVKLKQPAPVGLMLL